MTKCAYSKKICSLCLLRQGINRLRPSARHYTRGTRREIPNQQSLGEVRDFERFHLYIYFMICIYSSWYVSWYSYSGVGSKMPARKKKSKRRISIQSFVDKLSDDGGQPLRKEAFWTSMRILWTILQKLPSSERIGRLHSENIWKYVKMLMLRSDPHSRRPSTAMEAWQQHDLLHPLFQGRRVLKCVKRHFRHI